LSAQHLELLSQLYPASKALSNVLVILIFTARLKKLAPLIATIMEPVLMGCVCVMEILILLQHALAGLLTWTLIF